MNLDIFVQRPKLALVISLIIVIVGAVAIARIPIAEYPEITPPQVTVEAIYQGANATAVEESVASPIESKVNGVDDMIYMESKSNDSGQYHIHNLGVIQEQPLAHNRSGGFNGSGRFTFRHLWTTV